MRDFSPGILQMLSAEAKLMALNRSQAVSPTQDPFPFKKGRQSHNQIGKLS